MSSAHHQHLPDARLQSDQSHLFNSLDYQSHAFNSLPYPHHHHPQQSSHQPSHQDTLAQPSSNALSSHWYYRPQPPSLNLKLTFVTTTANPVEPLPPHPRRTSLNIRRPQWIIFLVIPSIPPSQSLLSTLTHLLFSRHLLLSISHSCRTSKWKPTPRWLALSTYHRSTLSPNHHNQTHPFIPIQLHPALQQHHPSHTLTLWDVFTDTFKYKCNLKRHPELLHPHLQPFHCQICKVSLGTNKIWGEWHPLLRVTTTQRNHPLYENCNKVTVPI